MSAQDLLTALFNAGIAISAGAPSCRWADAGAFDGCRHDLGDLDGARSCGAVRDSTMTPMARTAKARMPIAIMRGLLVKRSSNSQTLKMMAANGSMMTSTDCDTLNGPTCKAACSSSMPAIAAIASAYTGHRLSTPLMPEVVSIWVTVLRNVAISAQVNAARHREQAGPAHR
jgi:hypothetical protein